MAEVNKALIGAGIGGPGEGAALAQRATGMGLVEIRPGASVHGVG